MSHARGQVQYAALHIIAAPLPATGPYKMYWDAGVLFSLWTYWKLALGPSGLAVVGIPPSLARSLLTAWLAAGMVACLAVQLVKRQWIAAFFAAWFGIALAPVLPLREHVTAYYLTVPLLGFAMWAAWGFVTAWRAGSGARAIAILFAAAYLAVGAVVGHATAVSFRDEAARAHQAIDTVLAEARLQKAHRIILTGVDQELWVTAFSHRPLRLYGFDQVAVASQDDTSAYPSGPQTITVDLSRVSGNR